MQTKEEGIQIDRVRLRRQMALVVKQRDALARMLQELTRDNAVLRDEVWRLQSALWVLLYKDWPHAEEKQASDV